MKKPTKTTIRSKDEMVLICPMHKLMCTQCKLSTYIPLGWLSKKLQIEYHKIIKHFGK